MKIDLGNDQAVERGEPTDEVPLTESAVWVSLRCDVGGALHQAAVTPETARKLLGALRDFDAAGLLNDADCNTS